MIWRCIQVLSLSPADSGHIYPVHVAGLSPQRNDRRFHRAAIQDGHISKTKTVVVVRSAPSQNEAQHKNCCAWETGMSIEAEQTVGPDWQEDVFRVLKAHDV